MQFYRAQVSDEKATWWALPRGNGLQSSAQVVEAWSAAPFDGGVATGRVANLGAIGRLLAPATPTKIVCVGRNYAAHARELGNAVPTEPMLFLKPPSAIIGPHDAVIIPRQSSRVEHEAELAVVIGRRMRHVAAEHAGDYVFGYTCGLDMTARDLQRKDVQFTRGKGFDTFCPLGPCVVTDIDPTAIDVVCTVNGERRQHGNTSQMTFPVLELLSYISFVMTLEPGDVVLTGTPEGVGPVVSGDKLSMQITGIGELAVEIAADAGSPAATSA
jgi:2-keto-4-pentenoate hydratase/2-oxohepta-3-ene-1,7-dioic acid hydratase in catechol pathway